MSHIRQNIKHQYFQPINLPNTETNASPSLRNCIFSYAALENQPFVISQRKLRYLLLISNNSPSQQFRPPSEIPAGLLYFGPVPKNKNLFLPSRYLEVVNRGLNVLFSRAVKIPMDDLLCKVPPDWSVI